MCTCGILQNHRFARYHQSECVRDLHHNGEHLGKNNDGIWVIWWRDVACNCEACRSPEPIEWCEPWSNVTDVQARVLLDSSEATLLDWVGETVKLRT